MGRLYIFEEHTSHKNIYSIARSPQNSEFRGVKMPPRSRGRADKSRYWSNVLIWKAVLSSASVKDRRQGLVDKQCDQNTDHALDEILGTIAGDDTIMLVIREGCTRAGVKNALSLIIPNIQ